MEEWIGVETADTSRQAGRHARLWAVQRVMVGGRRAAVDVENKLAQMIERPRNISMFADSVRACVRAFDCSFCSFF